MRLPVIFIDGQWKLQNGAPVQFKDRAIAELLVDSAALIDRHFLVAATESGKVLVLPAGAELRVALTIKAGLDKSLRPFLIDRCDTPTDGAANVSHQTRFVSVKLRRITEPKLLPNDESDGLCFVFKGIEPVGIQSGVVELPNTHELQPVPSLNQAFTRLSEVFEPWRKAHTGNIYERVFYRATDGHWAPLKELRDCAIDEWWGEQQTANDSR